MKRSPAGRGHSFEPLSYTVLGACIDVQRQMGPHCMEVDYQRALEIALPRYGLHYQREADIPVVYDGVTVTTRRVDFLVWDDTGELLLEVKAASAIKLEDMEQCLLYLRQGGYRVCLLVNFGQVPLGIKRFVHTTGESLGHDSANRDEGAKGRPAEEQGPA